MENIEKIFKPSNEEIKEIIVVDNFYKNPDMIRAFALNQKYFFNNKFYKGLRTERRFNTEEIKNKFEMFLQAQINDICWSQHQFNGCFQITSAENLQVYHCDENSWAGVIYLTPDAPVQSGTKTYKSKSTEIRDQARVSSKEEMKKVFAGGFYDSTKFETVDSIGNLYNRLVLFKSTQIHSAGEYFGSSMWNGRLVQLFFFDTLNN